MQIGSEVVQPAAYQVRYVGSRLSFFFLFFPIFFFHMRGNDDFNNKVDYTFGHDNEEDGLNLSFQISYEGLYLHIAYFHDY